MPALIFSLYTRWFHRKGAARRLGGRHGLRHLDGLHGPGGRQARRRTSAARCELFPFTDTKGYIALTAFVINVLVAVLLTFVFRAMKVAEGADQTSPDDYHADAGDRGVEDVLAGEPGTAPTTR